MGMAKPMNGDYWYANILTVFAKLVVDCGVEDSAINKYWFILWQIFDKLGELGNCLPVDLDSAL